MRSAHKQAELPQPFRGAPRNRLLAALPAADLDRLRPHLAPVAIKRRSVLQDYDQAPEQVFFIESGLASLQVHTNKDNPVEVGVVGRMGLIGASSALSTSHAPIRAVMQIPGEALVIHLAIFRSIMTHSPALRQLLLNYMQAITIQSSQLVLCNARHETDQRVARWLLLAHNRLDGDQIPITHEVIGSNLGVRRAGVTDVLSSLERAGVVRTDRACITILDAKRLQELSCDCYRTISREYARLLQHPLGR